jgi:hypothetical protein
MTPKRPNPGLTPIVALNPRDRYDTSRVYQNRPSRPGGIMSKKILMLVGDFVEDCEVMVPFQTMAAI